MPLMKEDKKIVWLLGYKTQIRKLKVEQRTPQEKGHTICKRPKTVTFLQHGGHCGFLSCESTAKPTREGTILQAGIDRSNIYSWGTVLIWKILK